MKILLNNFFVCIKIVWCNRSIRLFRPCRLGFVLTALFSSFNISIDLILPNLLSSIGFDDDDDDCIILSTKMDSRFESSLAKISLLPVLNLFFNFSTILYDDGLMSPIQSFGDISYNFPDKLFRYTFICSPADVNVDFN
ncbi:hypothetical protein DERP_002444 [Dermatophagoides pteronyssinus]|uniref:Uncharacterized protein n=1 Tax=Dermatophagoides pteronyssinus TaxID=6956 RepID=A0ABQ8JHQ6_DERPT|nr:hypothetical protein DERP_002444 [Dermatophagoides pteronyssinus]